MLNLILSVLLLDLTLPLLDYPTVTLQRLPTLSALTLSLQSLIIRLVLLMEFKESFLRQSYQVSPPSTLQNPISPISPLLPRPLIIRQKYSKRGRIDQDPTVNSD